VTEDWAAVASTIEEHMKVVGLNQRELAVHAGVALSIVRELRHNTVQRRRNGRTLEAISVALGLHRRHLNAVLTGKQPPELGDPDTYPADGVPHQLARIEDRLNELADQLGAMDAKITRVIDSAWPNHDQ
jgi:hypothetical protein